MNLRRAIDEDSDDAIQMAPLIDIVFLLLVFFIVTSSLSQLEKEIEITLPTSQSAGDINRQSNEIVINMLRDGSLMINQESMLVSGLLPKLKTISQLLNNPTVMIRADGKVFHENVIKVLDACSKAKLKSVSFITLEDK